MRWIGTGFAVLIVVGFIWSWIGDLRAYLASKHSEMEECPKSEEVLNKVK